MNPAQRRDAIKALKALQKELLEHGPNRVEPNRADEARAGGDEDSQPLNEMLQAIASKRNAEWEKRLGRIRRALSKLEKNPADYGQCEECGEDIASARLKAMPFTELCVTCQAAQDAPRGMPTRKRLTDFR